MASKPVKRDLFVRLWRALSLETEEIHKTEAVCNSHLFSTYNSCSFEIVCSLDSTDLIQSFFPSVCSETDRTPETKLFVHSLLH